MTGDWLAAVRRGMLNITVSGSLFLIPPPLFFHPVSIGGSTSVCEQGLRLGVSFLGVWPKLGDGFLDFFFDQAQ